MCGKKCSLLFFLIFPINTFSSSITKLNATNFVTKDQTLVSSHGVFELGLFNLSDSDKWYVGIWYMNINPRTYVWVANRNIPLSNSAGVLKIVDHNIVLLDPNRTNPVWSSNITKGKNTVAELLDSGNLVLRETGDTNHNNYLWQSFDFPTNTLLPGMKLGRDPNTGLDWYLSSWKTPGNPTTGNYTLKLYDRGLPEFFVYNEMEDYALYRSGPWDGPSFNGLPDSTVEFELNMSYNDKISRSNIKYWLSLKDISDDTSRSTIPTRFTMDPTGNFKYSYWDAEVGEWTDLWTTPKDRCDYYGACGPYYTCYAPNIRSNECECLEGFTPKEENSSWSDGCVRKTKLSCSARDNFLTLKNVKFPDSTWVSVFVDRNMSIEECRNRCLRNCSCTAYAKSDIRDGGFGCVIWFGELEDIREYQNGLDLFVRVAASDDQDKQRIKRITLITGATVSGILIIFILLFFSWRLIPKYREWKKRFKELELFQKRKTNLEFPSETLGDKMQELPLFSFEELATATNNFDPTNQLGRGGFGPVYKGTLENGQEIAVKRLSIASGQGVEEFMNEVLVISKVQHRNLVRLLGCCIEHNEKILVYEYMPNKSLDALLFGRLETECLDWRTRFNIIEGISRGLLYLHRDSRLRIIHRDLKAANILLDENLNPKISDFGMARIFGNDEDQVNTKRVMGTYGYMSPEYAMEGRFSEKSDVFSFGVLLLEIVGGRRNTSFYNDEHNLSLIRYGWKLWNEGNILDMVDKAVSDPSHHREATRCIHVGLLCVQEFAEDRPTMSKVISMLNSDIQDLPPPKQPAFVEKQISSSVAWSSLMGEGKCHSVNGVTITNLHGR